MTAGTTARGLALGLGAALLAMIGCNRGAVEEVGLSKTTFFKVKNGMSRAEVTAILGEGTEVRQDDIPKMPGMEKWVPPNPALLKVRDENAPKQPEAPDAPKDRGGLTRPPEPPMRDVKSVTWVKYGEDDKFILVGYAEDILFEKREHGVIPK